MKKSKLSQFEGETIAAQVPISEMIIDEYQGHVNERIVEKIAKEWSDSAAGAIILNMREDDTYAVLDGQHRYLAAKKVGVQALNALVFVGKSREEEAKLFVQLNTKHQVMAFDRFRAYLLSGSKREQDITKIVEELGLKVSNVPNSAKAVRSVVTLGKIYDTLGPAHLKVVLGVLNAAFDSYADQQAYGGGMLEGMSQLLFRYPEVNIPYLTKKLSRYSPSTIRGMAATKKSLGETEGMTWGKTFTGIYNHGIGAGRANYLDPVRWNKAKYTPKGLKAQSAKGKAAANREHLKKYRFVGGVRHTEQPVILAAAAKKSKA